MHYRFYLLDREGACVDVAETDCASDEDALREAAARLGVATGVQVWQRGRFVSRVGERVAA